jgi:hypothetical protein
MLLSLEFRACTHRRTIADFWGQADTPSGSGKRLQMPDIVAKVFLGWRPKIEPLLRFMRGDVRDHIVSSKIDHEPPQWR